MKAIDIRQALAGKTNRPAEAHAIETLGGMELNIKHLSGFDSDTMQMSVLNDEAKVEVSKLRGQRARIVAACVVDEEGEVVFEATDVAKWDNDILAEVYGICRKVNKMGKEEVEAEEKG